MPPGDFEQRLGARRLDSGALPRKINLLAHHTLLVAVLTRATLATADHVQAALHEIA